MILIPGHSGCKVEVIKTSHSSFVRKSTSNVDYIPRLTKQCQKQIEYSKYFDSNYILVPKVLNIEESNNNYSFDMQFVSGMDVITYLEYAPREKIDEFVDSITTVIKSLVKDSKTVDVTDKIQKKYVSVKDKIRPRWSLTNEEEKILDQKIFKNKVFLPVGRCHGDLTLSNILVNRDNEKIHLIDFLDSFIETPLQDMVKIRQDTKFRWSLLLFKGTIDSVRMKTVFAYMDNSFVKTFKRFDFYNKHYDVIQLINILRVMNYTFNENIFLYLEKCIRRHLGGEI